LLRTGSFGSATRLKLMAVVSEAKSNDPFGPVTVVVPTPYAGLSLRRYLSGGTGLVNVRFMVLPRLAEYLGSPAMAKQGKAPLSGLLQMAAIRLVSIRMNGHGPLGGIAEHTKLHECLRRTFADMARLSETGLKQLAGTDALRGQLVEWYMGYREVLHDYYDREELARAASVAVESGEAASALRDLGYIVFYLAHNPSPSEKALASALHRRGLCSTIPCLTGEAEIDDWAWCPDDGPKSKHAVEDPEAGLPPERPKASHLLIASNAHEEVRWVVRHIMRHAERGVPFHRMAVLYRQDDPYGSLLRSHLAFGRVPVAGPDPVPLGETPAGKLILYLLEVMEEHGRDAVMRWLCEAPVRIGAGVEAASSELARWDSVSREAGIVGGAAQWQERLDGYIALLAERINDLEDSGEASPGRTSWLQADHVSAERLKSFMAELAAIRMLADGSTWRAFSRWAADLLKRYAIEPSEWPEEHRSSYERVMSAIEGLSSLDQFETRGVGMLEFVRALSGALETPSGRAGQTGKGVFVGPLVACQGMEFDVVYIVGMAEGAFPPGVADDPVLPDAVRRSLGDTEVLPSVDMRRLEERRLFLAAMSAGSEIVLSYPVGDASARRGQYPSPWFIEEASRLNGARLSTADLEKLHGAPWLSRIHSLQHGLGYAEALSPADDHDYDMHSISAWYSRGNALERHYLLRESQVPGKAVMMEQLRNGASLTEWDGKVPAMPAMGLPGGDGKPVSPTSLETWATCPFKYFLGHMLRVSVPESPEEVLTLSPLERGALMHRVLEHFIKECASRGTIPGFGSPWTVEHETVLLGIAAKEFDRADARGITGKHVFWEALKEEMRRDLVALLEDDSQWRAGEKARPLWNEKAFGMGGDDGLPPVEIVLPGGVRVAFRGRIDRVDECQPGLEGAARLNVVDYKFGSAMPFKEMGGDPLSAGRHLQLPVYALAVRQATKGPAEVRSMYWFATAKGEFQRKSVDLDKVEAKFGEVVSGITGMIRQGLFPANPGQNEYRDNCTYCDFRRVCPPDRDLAWERKSRAPELAPYLGLASIMDVEGEES